MSRLNELLHITPDVCSLIPEIEKPLNLGRAKRDHGESIFLNVEPVVKLLGILKFYPNIENSHGHIHHKRTEYIYILEGKLQGYFWDPYNPNDKKEVTLLPGCMVKINPGLAHGYKALELTTALEFSPNVFDHNDHKKVPNPFISANSIE